MELSLDRLVKELKKGLVKRIEIKINPAKMGKAINIDAHILYYNQTATKITGLSSVILRGNNS